MGNQDRLMEYYKSDIHKKRQDADMKRFREEYPDGYVEDVQTPEEFAAQQRDRVKRIWG